MIAVEQGNANIETVTVLVEFQQKKGVGELVLEEKISSSERGRERPGLSQVPGPFHAFVLQKLHGGGVLNKNLHMTTSVFGAGLQVRRRGEGSGQKGDASKSAWQGAN